MVINTFQLFHKQIFFCKSRKKPKKQNITEQQIANRSDMDRYIGDWGSAAQYSIIENNTS